MNKKIIIVFVLAIVAATVFLYVRNIKKSENDQVLGQQAFAKLTEISKKIPQAGLTQMGLAVKQYQEKKGKYPEKLADLYPDFIPSKEFINGIEWHYEASGNDFLLTKTITKGQERLVASVNKELIPKMSGEMMVATTDNSASTVKEGQGVPEIPELKPLLPPRPIAYGPGSDESAVETLIEPPEIVSVEKGQIKAGVTGGMGRGILVWKDANGTLGFGNVIYPETNRLSVYRNNMWITMKRPLPKPPSDTTETIQGADAYGETNASPGTYYAWRDENGTKGFGNVSLPEEKPVKILRNNEWVDLKELRGEEPPIMQPESKTEENRQPDQLAADYSNRYLVWKDKRGNLGYGNIQYPGTQEVAYICVDGNWQKVVN